MQLSRRRFLLASALAPAGLAACADRGPREAPAGSSAVRTVAYGADPSQVADLHRASGAAPSPVVVLVHGGFWQAAYDRTLMDGLAADLTDRGLAVWNIEYRRVGQRGGGWPGLFDDVAAAVDALAAITGEEQLDLHRVVVIGHSSGGQIALWLAARARLPPGAPGANPRVTMRAAVAQAGVADLAGGFTDDVGSGAIGSLMGGGPQDHPERYRVTDPIELLPLGVAQLLVHGTADNNVPVSQSRNYAAAARSAGDDVELVELEGVGHFEHLDPASRAWRAVTDRLPRLLA